LLAAAGLVQVLSVIVEIETAIEEVRTLKSHAIAIVCGTFFFLVFSALEAGVTVDPSHSAAATDIFHKPLRLRAGDAFIDTGEAWGHSGPCIADVDGDGKLDLVVGDFSGQFRFYKNIGSNAEPKFAPCTYLMAGNEVAKVPIY
jgi:hypothetical protein